MEKPIITYEWSSLLTPKKWHLPAYKNYDFSAGEFRDIVIVWNDFIKMVPAGTVPPMWAVYCDVLRLDTDVIFDKTTIIFARRIEVAKDLSIIIDNTRTQDTDFLLYTQQVVNYKTGKTATLQITSVAADETEQHVIVSSTEEGAAGVNWEAGKQPVAGDTTTIPPDEAMLIEGDPLRLSLSTTFQIATLLCTTELDLALAQLQWIQKLAVVNGETRDMALQAGAMGNNLRLQRLAGENAVLVPFLDSTVYANSAKSLMTLLTMRDAKWTNLQNLKRDDENWREVVNDAVGDKNDQKELSLQLQHQAERSLDQAIQARSIAAKLIIEAQSTLEAKRIWFEEVGIPAWQRKETLNAVIDMVMGIVDILKQIPAIVAGGPEFAAMPIIEAGMSLVKGVTDLVVSSDKEPPVFGPLTKDETAAKKRQAKEAAARKAAGAKMQESLVKAGEGGKKVFDAAMKIAAIAAQAAAMEESSTKILSAIGDTVDQGFSSVSVTGLDVATGGSQEWDLLGIEIEQVFEDIEPLKAIEGGSDYRLEFRKLIIKGKALSQARLGVAKATAQFAEMKVRTQAAEKSLKRSKERMDKLDIRIQQDETMLQYAFNKVLDVKRSIYMALESYRRASLYFTLSERNESLLLPKLLDTVDQFQTTVSAVSSNEFTFSKAFGENLPRNYRQSLVLSDPALLDGLYKNGYFTWTLKYDDDRFKNFARIRFTNVNVFVGFKDGYKYDKDVSVRILSSGFYSDKNTRKTEKTFVGPATHLNFEYAMRDGKPDISFDGNVDPRYANDFFNPTPFTTWTFSFNNDDIDISKVEKLTVVFSGNALSI